MMLASGSITRAASTRSASSCARATAKLALTTVMSLPSSIPLAMAYILMHLELRTAHVGGKLLALEIGERLDLVVLGEDHEIGEREGGAEDAQRHAFLIEFLQDRRPADQRIGLAGGKAGVECGDRRIRLGVQLEAVLGVEPARLHDVPDERIEHRQREARCGDLRFLLRERTGRAGDRDGTDGHDRDQAATKNCHHEAAPLR